MEVTIEQLKALIIDGKRVSLSKDFYHSGTVFVGKGRILTIDDTEKLKEKIKGSLDVRLVQDELVPQQVKKAILDEIIKIFQTHNHYKNIPSGKRKQMEKIIQNVFLDSDYISYALRHIHHFSKKLFVHSVNVAIISLIVDYAWQKRFNHGLIDGMKLENIFFGALLHDIGYLSLDQNFCELKRKDKDFENIAQLKDHPSTGYDMLLQDTQRHQFPPDVTRVVLEHEERVDGSGFPRGVEESLLHINSQIVGLCNEFEHLLNGEMTDHSRTFLDISRYLMARKHSYNKDCVNVLIEEFRYLEKHQ